jgi:hypothetical protein
MSYVSVPLMVKIQKGPLTKPKIKGGIATALFKKRSMLIAQRFSEQFFRSHH